MKLLFDTETSGLARFDLPPSAPEQPRLVQLGMILVDEKNEIVHECGVIVKPEGFVIPEEVSRVHGITHEYALKYGVPLSMTLCVFGELIKKCSCIIGHNLKFDKLIIESELSRIDSKISLNTVQSQYCTMLTSTPICRLPQKNGKGLKWPKLSEAYQYFFNEELKDAHDALTDVRATLRLYKHLTAPLKV